MLTSIDVGSGLVAFFDAFWLRNYTQDGGGAVNKPPDAMPRLPSE
jgi:hypothetical protein